MYSLLKVLLISTFSFFNTVLIIILSENGIENVYGIIFSSSLVIMTLCSILISKMDNYYYIVAIESIQFMNKNIANTKKYKRNHTVESLDKMSKTASNRKRDPEGKFI